jgi:hydroxymethylpyrimidine/phosphomethylpyrimidine kinase
LIPVALTIAGSDSGGGAGIQADLKTFHAFGVFGTSAITALTAQNTLGVSGIHLVPVEFVRAQIRAVVSDLHPAACKTGMLGSRDLVYAVADAIEEHELVTFVLDPVMVATSRDRLLDRDAEDAISERLMPLCGLVTPNLPEAGILTGMPIRDEHEMRQAAEQLVAMGARGALVKGGHLEGDDVVDVLFDGREFHAWRRERIAGTSMHGTGCTLSAGIAAGLAHGWLLRDAVERALEFVARAIATAPGLGGGHGPINHFSPVQATTPER